MTRHSLSLMAVLTWGLIVPPVLAQSFDQPAAPSASTVQPAGRSETIDTYVNAIEQAREPSAAVSAYAKGYAIDPQNRALEEAYVNRMVEFGLPRAAYNQAQALVDLDRNNGLAWSVLSYVAARQGQMAEALVDIVQAAALRPDHWFVQEVAGQLLAWYDITRPTVSDSLRNSLDRLRSKLQGERFFADAYRYAQDDLRQAAAAQTQPARRADQAQRPSQPAYQPDYDSGTAGLYPPPESIFPYSTSYLPLDLYRTEPYTDTAYSYIPSYPGYASTYVPFYPSYPYGIYYPTYQPAYYPYYPYYYDFPFFGYPFYPFFGNNVTVIVKDRHRHKPDLFAFLFGRHGFGDKSDGRFGDRFEGRRGDRFDINRGRGITSQVDGRRMTYFRGQSRMGEPERRVPIFRSEERASLSFGPRDVTAPMIRRSVNRGGAGYGSQAQNPQGASVIPRVDVLRSAGAQRAPMPAPIQPSRVEPRRMQAPSRSFGAAPYVGPAPRSYSAGPRTTLPSVAPRSYSAGRPSMGVPRASISRSAPAATPRVSVGRSGGGGRR